MSNNNMVEKPEIANKITKLEDRVEVILKLIDKYHHTIDITKFLRILGDEDVFNGINFSNKKLFNDLKDFGILSLKACVISSEVGKTCDEILQPIDTGFCIFNDKPAEAKHLPNKTINEDNLPDIEEIDEMLFNIIRSKLNSKFSDYYDRALHKLNDIIKKYNVPILNELDCFRGVNKDVTIQIINNLIGLSKGGTAEVFGNYNIKEL